VHKQKLVKKKGIKFKDNEIEELKVKLLKKVVLLANSLAIAMVLYLVHLS
jgi:uncharacterized FlgJ-related protein